EPVEAAPARRARPDAGDPGLARLGPGAWRIVPGHDGCARALKRGDRRQPRFAEAHEGEAPLGEGGEIDHPPHRSFKGESPASGRIEAMIQKRITMVGSAQPFFSKGWWSGAMRKTRLPVSLKERTWTMTETVSRTKSPPTMASTSSCLTMTEMVPSAPPTER